MIRQAVQADGEAVRAIAQAAFAGYVAAIGRPPAPMTADHAAAIAAGEVAVSEGPEGIDGFVVFRAGEGRMLLDTVAVAPGAAGRGLGRALVARCEAEALRLGLPCVELYTNAAMTANLSLYPHLGYVETGRRREDGFERVYFRKALAGDGDGPA